MKQLAFDILGAAKTSGLGRSLIYAAMGTGELRAKKLGKRTIILASDLEKFLEALPDYKDAKFTGSPAVRGKEKSG